MFIDSCLSKWISRRNQRAWRNDSKSFIGNLDACIILMKPILYQSEQRVIFYLSHGSTFWNRFIRISRNYFLRKEQERRNVWNLNFWNHIHWGILDRRYLSIMLFYFPSCLTLKHERIIKILIRTIKLKSKRERSTINRVFQRNQLNWWLWNIFPVITIKNPFDMTTQCTLADTYTFTFTVCADSQMFFCFYFIKKIA